MKLKAKLQAMGNWALDLIWPRYCELCSRPVDRPGRLICSECLERIPFIPTDGLCRKCGRDVPGLDGEYLCEDCRTYKPAFGRCASAVRYRDNVRQLVLRFKFNRAFYLRADFVDWMEAAIRARFVISEIDWLLPMPASMLHRYLRGYNQVEILGKVLARHLQLPYNARVLRRKLGTRKQLGLDAKARRENVKGTFVVRQPRLIADKTVLVIDDVMTTGSTLSECAAELKRAGAKRVWCATLASLLRD